MDARLKLPPRPELINSSLLFTPAHMLFIDNCILMGEAHDKLYKTILAPNATPGKVRSDKSALMATKVAEEYIEKRTRQLLVHFGIEKPSDGEVESAFSSGEIPEDWKDQILTLAKRKALDGKLPDDKAAELVLKSILKDDDSEQAVEAPRRYLPESMQNHKHHIWVLNLLAGGDAIDCCQYCKAKALHPEFDDSNLLDIPKEIYNELDEKSRKHIENRG